MEVKHLYLYETVDDAKKAMKKEILNFNEISAVSKNVIISIYRFIRCILIWTYILLLGRSLYSRIFDVGYKFSFKYFWIFFTIRLCAEIIFKYVKFCYDNSYAKHKAAIVRCIIYECEELIENNYSHWQLDAIIDDMLEYANNFGSPYDNDNDDSDDNS